MRRNVKERKNWYKEEKKPKRKKKWVITFEIWNALCQPQPGLLKFGSYIIHILPFYAGWNILN